MRIWGSLYNVEETLRELKKKLEYFTGKMMIVAIEENYQFSSDKIQKNVIGLSQINNLSELLTIGKDPVEFQVLGKEFVTETYTDKGTVYVKYRKWENPSVEESDKILAKKDLDEIFRNSSPLGDEILRFL